MAEGRLHIGAHAGSSGPSTLDHFCSVVKTACVELVRGTVSDRMHDQSVFIKAMLSSDDAHDLADYSPTHLLTAKLNEGFVLAELIRAAVVFERSYAAKW
jgi:hypothetical protein